MKKIIVICLLCTLTAISYAADTSKRERVEELLVLMNASSVIETIYSQIDQMIQSMAQQLGVKPFERELFDKYVAKMVVLMKSEMNWDKMKGPMIDLYLKHYTEKEIGDMVAFYKSDSGQSMIKKMPAVMRDSILISQDMMKDFIPKMQAMSIGLKNEINTARKRQ